MVELHVSLDVEAVHEHVCCLPPAKKLAML